MFWTISFRKQQVLGPVFELWLFLSPFTWENNPFQISSWSPLLPAVQQFRRPGTVQVDRGANVLPSQLPLSPDLCTPVKYQQSHSKSRHIHKGSLILFNPMHVWARWWHCIPSNQGHALENYAPFTSVSEPALWSAFFYVPSGDQIIDLIVNFWLNFLSKRTMV